jgi:hypothetical protein
MATTPVEFEVDTGLTLTLKLFPHGSDTIANGAGDTAVEATNRLGVYSANVTEALSGLHHAIIVTIRQSAASAQQAARHCPSKATSDNAGGAIIDSVTILGTEAGTYTQRPKPTTRVITSSPAPRPLWIGSTDSRSVAGTLLRRSNGKAMSTRTTTTLPCRLGTARRNLLSVLKVNTSRTVGYANGEVWIDTVAGTAGTESFVNGVADNPVLTLADALTIATANKLTNFNIANGNTITLAGATTNKRFEGHEWILALGGQNISGTNFEGANAVTGTSSGTTDVQFEDCVIGNGSRGQRCHPARTSAAASTPAPASPSPAQRQAGTCSWTAIPTSQ